LNRLRILFLSFLLLFGIFPSVSFAAPPDKELTAFLKETNWTLEGLNDHLEYFWDMNIDEFESIEELKDFLSEPITEENLQQLLTEYEFANEEELVALLVENGEMEAGENIRDVFRYYDALDYTVSFYKNTGTEITEENLQQLIDEYGLETKENLIALLEKYDDSLENYQYIEDLDLMVSIYLGVGEFPGEDEISQMLADLGITDEEIEALFTHFMSLNFEDQAFLDKMLELENRIMAFGDFESADDLTDEQIAELISIMREMMDLFQLDAEFFLVKGNDRIPLSTEELMVLEDTNGNDLLIELYSTKNDFLADILITADMFSSELLEDTVSDMNQAEEIIKKQEPLKVKAQKTNKTHKTIKTVKGGKLPNTAGNYTEGILAGLALIAAGAIVFRKRNVKHS
jgi:processed acidic surface protein